MKLGFIGLGSMGFGMAKNLANYGGDYIVCDLDEEKLRPFRELNVSTTTEAAELLDRDVIFLCLPSSKELLGSLEERFRTGQCIVDSSTMRWQDAKALAERLAARGVDYIDATVAGRAAWSIAGTLTIMCGGRREAFERVKPCLDCMGKAVLYMGPSGTGQIMKMVNNCISYITIAALCEILPVAVKLGLDPETVGEAINSASAQSYSSQNLIPAMLAGDFSYDTMNACYKNVKNMQEILTELHLPLPTFGGMLQSYQLAMSMGYGEDYYTSMIRPYEQMLGVEFRKEKEGKML